MTEVTVTTLRSRELTIPQLCLVVLIGVSGSGKSTFARTNFKSTEVLSSDFCRGLVSDDENDQAASKDAFDVLHYIAGKRLAAGRLTVIDATNVQPASRKQLVDLARAHDVLPVAIVLDMPEGCEDCSARAFARSTFFALLRRSTRRPSCGSGCTTTCATCAAPSMRSATFTAAAQSSRRCSESSDMSSPVTTRDGRSMPRTLTAAR
jgi:predicted kinase